MLNFDPTNNNSMKYFISNSNEKNKLNNNPKQISLEISSKYYSQLCIFEYIGIKFFNYQI